MGNFTDTLPDSPDALEAVVRAERQQLKASIEELGTVMRNKVNVRSQFREHPLASVGLGLLAGITLGALSNRASKSTRHNSPDQKSFGNGQAHSSTSHRESGALGKFGTSMLAIVGTRVADLAEDTLRSALSRSRVTVPARDRS
jgi:hypothetical protein